MRLIGFIAALHHRGERPRRVSSSPSASGSGAKVEQRRAFEIARHQKAAGRQCRKSEILGPAGTQIGGKKIGGAARLVFIGWRGRRFGLK